MKNPIETFLKDRINFCNTKIEEFKKEFEENPLRAINDRIIFKNIVEHKQCSLMLNALKEKYQLKDLLYGWERDIKSRTIHPTHSTCPINNYISQIEVSVKAQLHEDLTLIYNAHCRKREIKSSCKL